MCVFARACVLSRRANQLIQVLLSRCVGASSGVWKQTSLPRRSIRSGLGIYHERLHRHVVSRRGVLLPHCMSARPSSSFPPLNSERIAHVHVEWAQDTVGPFSMALRNKLTAVRQFFEEKHRGCYMVFNRKFPRFTLQAYTPGLSLQNRTSAKTKFQDPSTIRRPED